MQILIWRTKKDRPLKFEGLKVYLSHFFNASDDEEISVKL